jgi:hypothetical protein
MLEMEDVGFSATDFVRGRESGKRETSGVSRRIAPTE